MPVCSQHKASECDWCVATAEIEKHLPNPHIPAVGDDFIKINGALFSLCSAHRTEALSRGGIVDSGD